MKWQNERKKEIKKRESSSSSCCWALRWVSKRRTRRRSDNSSSSGSGICVCIYQKMQSTRPSECVRDFLSQTKSGSARNHLFLSFSLVSSLSSSTSFFLYFLRVPHGLLEHTTCDGFTFQQQVSVLGRGWEDTRESQVVACGYRRQPRTQHSRERESVCVCVSSSTIGRPGSQAAEKNTTVADQVAIKTVHSSFVSLTVLFFVVVVVHCCSLSLCFRIIWIRFDISKFINRNPLVLRRCDSVATLVIVSLDFD